MSTKLPSQEQIEILSDKVIKLSYHLQSQCDQSFGDTEDSNEHLMNDLEFERYTNPAFQTIYEATLSCSFESVHSTLQMMHFMSKNAVSTPAPRRFDDAEDLLDNFDLIVDALDDVYEKIDVGLDIMSGKLKATVPVNAAQSAPMMAEFSQVIESKKIDVKLVHAQNITRPQLSFVEKVDNSAAPFVPKITKKPNAIVLLPDSFTGAHSLNRHTLHPYEYEIQHVQYPESQFEHTATRMYLPLESTPYEWIDTERQLIALSAYLDTVSEMAVDLENHNYRSYQGFCCLMQISTREKDFLIDAIQLRHHMHILNHSFTNPNILKVFHGAVSDVQWLQRDFGLYLVNLFDTFFASKILEFPSYSLAFLLKHYVNINADKKFQLADWRIRPIPAEMIKYAREDTHYLLYIYDMLKKNILARAHEPLKLLKSVYQKSAQLALDRYEKEVYDASESWKMTYYKYQKPLSASQMNVFKAIHAWRDHVAREEDESVRYVLPNHMMLLMAEKMAIDASGVLGCCNPVPPLVRQHATDLALLIQRAKAVTTDPITKQPQSSIVEALPESSQGPSDSVTSEPPLAHAEASVDSEKGDEMAPLLVVPEITQTPRMHAPKSSFMSAFGKQQPTKERTKMLRSIQDSLHMSPVTPTLLPSDPVEAVGPSVISSDVSEPAVVAAPPTMTEPIENSEDGEDGEVPAVASSTKRPKLDLLQFIKPGGSSTPAKALPSRPMPDMIPFDYEAESSKKPSMPSASAPLNKKKQNKHRNFNPYADIQEPDEFKRRERQSNSQPASGNKSMTFKRQK